jgi:large subunit ribosomal protein L17
MRHGKRVKKLGRTKSHRRAMLANMAASLFMYRMIETTEAKAKEVKKLAEKLITLAKRGDLHAHRQVYDVIRDRKLVKKIFDEIAPKFNDREGGYTRVVRLGVRKGDGAPVSVVELLIEKPPKEEKKGKKEKAPKKIKPEKIKEAKPAEEKRERVETKDREVKKEEEETEKEEKESKEGEETDSEKTKQEESK